MLINRGLRQNLGVMFVMIIHCQNLSIKGRLETALIILIHCIKPCKTEGHVLTALGLVGSAAEQLRAVQEAGAGT